ncbi:MAG: 4Fe-4S ferredoxin [Bacteroidetes bacterium CG2_30_33_31]|nr:MAG: 4Fe-4S ferredoxin [Bacteroidetes bacterium CG2_30_33_31]
MAITKVWVEDGCTSCGLCEGTAPEVFEIDDVSEVIAGVDFSLYEDAIKEAADECPVEVIKFS